MREPSRHRGNRQLAMARRPAPLALDACACFDDEVAVDFPSIGEAIDRERRSFLGDDDERDALRAELQVSAREAVEGATVALDVPVRRTCTRCGGRGECWLESCPDCAGSGVWRRSQRVHVWVPPGVSHGDRFRFTITAPCAATTHVDVRVAIHYRF